MRVASVALARGPQLAGMQLDLSAFHAGTFYHPSCVDSGDAQLAFKREVAVINPVLPSSDARHQFRRSLHSMDLSRLMAPTRSMGLSFPTGKTCLTVPDPHWIQDQHYILEQGVPGQTLLPAARSKQVRVARIQLDNLLEGSG